MKNINMNMDGVEKLEYNRAKIWEIFAFSTNNTATNIYLFLMMYVSYFAAGILGLGTVIVSTIITASRIFDGITDPIIGLWIDKTNGKFGKFRPFMILGNTIMAIDVLLMYFTTPLFPQNMRLIYWSLLYMIYIIGYTMQTACTKSGQSVLTNDPHQRPLFSTFDLTFTSLLFTGGAIYISSYLQPKYGGFTQSFYNEFVITTVIISAILTIFAVVGIRSHDRIEYFGTGNNQGKIRLRDMFQVLSKNRPLQMLIIAASTDKLGYQITSNSIVMVMLFGIIIGDYSIYGTISGIALIPNLIIVYFGTKFASKVGTKKAYVTITWVCIILYSAMFLVFYLGDPSQINFKNINFVTIMFTVLYILGSGVRTVSGGLVIPMIPDVIDYETYKNDRYAPGIISTIFSFVDKTISSFAQTIIATVLAVIGFTKNFPDIDTPYTEKIFWATMFLFIGMLLLAWFVSLIAMRFYELDVKKMSEIQAELQKRRINETVI
ncbi:MFS transporter [Garciella nitratireducens]|uniref:Na+/melibiose symporter n=1 Tax=Garciella nitratireducens DSM 15102 TaxID=1121911 RepID=A0A1T4P393_9FIRM|nr:MFS transporter [Garciella nitratireducens]SJZ85974.1 Na+/melibiose symporter [Garciella nitratireducens DSM 15102]